MDIIWDMLMLHAKIADVDQPAEHNPVTASMAKLNNPTAISSNTI
jgi:hypothetical protein